MGQLFTDFSAWLLTMFEESWETLVVALTGLYKLLLDVFGQILGYFVAFLWYVIAWLLTALDYILRHISAGFVEAAGNLLHMIPAPDFLNSVMSTWNSIPMDQFAWFANMFEVGYGLTIVSSAYVIKFGLRFIPYAGAAFRS